MELLNNRCAFYMLGRGSQPQTSPLSVNAFCIVTNSARETPVYPKTEHRKGREGYGKAEFGQDADCTPLLTANAGQYTSSICLPLLFRFPCNRQYMNVWTFSDL